MLKDNKYKKYIQSLPCIWCGTRPPSEQNHIGSGTDKRNNDYDSCPMCHICHQRWHGIVLVINGVKFLPFTKEQKQKIIDKAKKIYKDYLSTHI